jgi:hypothetical protein
MADFITKAENNRRLAVIIVCALGMATSLTVVALALKNKGFLEDHPENPRDIKKQLAKLEEMRAANVELLKNYLGYPKDIGWREISTGTVDRLPSGGLAGEKLKSFLSDIVKLPAERAAKGEKAVFEQLGITKYKRWDDPGAGEALTLAKLFDELLEKEKEFETKIGDLKVQTVKERDAEKEVHERIKAENERGMKEIDGGVGAAAAATGHIGELVRLNKEINQLQKQHAEELAALDKETAEAQNKATETKNDFVRKRASADAVKKNYRERIYAIHHHREEARERREPDGEVVGIDEKFQLVFINLLRKDRLFKGTKFRCYSLEKGGQKLDKGEIEVHEVRDSLYSVCSIQRVYDPEWPLKVGDKIYNELYEGGRTRHIAIAGRFTGKLSNDEAGRVIRAYGDLFQERVDENTNYVIVAEGYEEHPNYKAALEYGIKILREPILYDYLGVRRE